MKTRDEIDNQLSADAANGRRYLNQRSGRTPLMDAPRKQTCLRMFDLIQESPYSISEITDKQVTQILEDCDTINSQYEGYLTHVDILKAICAGTWTELTGVSASVHAPRNEPVEPSHKECSQTARTSPTQRQGVYANAVVKDGRRIWLSVGKTGKQTFAVRHDEYHNGKWFCCDDKTGKSITAEFSCEYMLDRLESLGWTREWHELSLDPESEQHHWQQLQPILQRGRSGPFFSKVLKLNGRAPETGFDNWYIQGGYGNKAQPAEPSIRDAAIKLLKPEIEKLISEIERDL